MANHKSALKRARQSEKRATRNMNIKSRMRTFIRKYREALESGDASAAQTSLRQAESEIRRAATKGVIPKERASRSISRLAKALPAS